MLIGNSRYKDKTAEYYLQNFEKVGVINEELLLQNYVEKPPLNNLKSQISNAKFSIFITINHIIMESILVNHQ